MNESRDRANVHSSRRPLSLSRRSGRSGGVANGPPRQRSFSLARLPASAVRRPADLDTDIERRKGCCCSGNAPVGRLRLKREGSRELVHELLPANRGKGAGKRLESTRELWRMTDGGTAGLR